MNMQQLPGHIAVCTGIRRRAKAAQGFQIRHMKWLRHAMGCQQCQVQPFLRRDPPCLGRGEDAPASL